MSRHCRASPSISRSSIARARPRPRQSRATTIMLRVPAGPNGVARAVPISRSPSRAAMPRLRPRISAQSSGRCGQPSARESATAPSRWAGVSASKVAVSVVSVIGHLLAWRHSGARPARRCCAASGLAAQSRAVLAGDSPQEMPRRPARPSRGGGRSEAAARNKLPRGAGDTAFSASRRRVCGGPVRRRRPKVT